MNRFVAIFACLVATTTWAQEQEPNNDRASANAIGHGQVIRGSITAGDEDYYVVTLSGVATIDIWTSAVNGGRTVDTYLEMFAENQETRIAYNDDRGGRAVGLYSGINRADVAAGTYYFKLRGFSRFSIGDYQIHLELSVGPDLSVSNFTLNPQPAP